MTTITVTPMKKSPESIRVCALCSGDFFIWEGAIYLVLHITDFHVKVQALAGPAKNFLREVEVYYIKNLQVLYEI